MKTRIFTLLMCLVLLAGVTTTAAAQEYAFQVTQEVVNVFWNSDGTMSLDYVITFWNNNGAHVIDFVDLGLPNGSYDINSISADVGGNSLNISSDFQGDGPYGVAIEMGAYAIQAGGQGRVHVFVRRIEDVFYPDDQDETYASGNFASAYWTTALGTTDLTVSFHLPPGVQPQEPRWHTPEGGWPGDSTPQGSLDGEGRVTYTWHSNMANAYSQFTFGMSVPRTYIPAEAIYTPPVFDSWNINFENLIPAGMCCFFLFMFVGAPLLGVINERKRKMQYLPPKIAIEGNGIKRGLTAVEAAILMEQPLDKVMTMILFGVIKKGAASVVTRDPLKLTISDPIPMDLHEYEREFLQAFKDPNVKPKALLSTMTINLVKSVGDKMKGFSRKESIAFYRTIMERAWAQIEAAGTPEMKSDLYEKSMEWTMLDKEYDDRTRRVFSGPIFVPTWWGHYDPTYRPATSSLPKMTGSTPTPSIGKSSTSIPGSTFAASVVTGAQTFASRVLGDVGGFTSGVTKTTNPPPVVKSTYKGGGGGGGGRSCACACACAGCACACAGGGR